MLCKTNASSSTHRMAFNPHHSPQGSVADSAFKSNPKSFHSAIPCPQLPGERPADGPQREEAASLPTPPIPDGPVLGGPTSNGPPVQWPGRPCPASPGHSEKSSQPKFPVGSLLDEQINKKQNRAPKTQKNDTFYTFVCGCMLGLLP